MGQDGSDGSGPGARLEAQSAAQSEAQREAAIAAILARIQAGLAGPRDEELPEPAHIYAPLLAPSHASEAADDQSAP